MMTSAEPRVDAAPAEPGATEDSVVARSTNDVVDTSSERNSLGFFTLFLNSGLSNERRK